MMTNGKNLLVPNGRSSRRVEQKATRSLLVPLFLLSLVIPIRPEILGLRLDTFRIFIILVTLPLCLKMVISRTSRLTMTDVSFFLFSIWIVITLIIHHGLGRAPYSIMLSLEFFGGYIAGRVLISNFSDYRWLISCFLTLLLLLFPFAVYELFTFRMVLSEFFGTIFPTVTKFHEARFGLSRVQVAFRHAIHFGLFSSIAVANAYYLYRARPLKAFFRYFLALSMTAMALSSAPILSALLQILMILWDRITKGRWWLLFILCGCLYVTLEILSNRGPIILLIENLTLNPRTAWWRVHIWNYGIDSVVAHPFIGIGLNDWQRPYWLASTVDNFWLLIAMRHGLPSSALIVMAIMFHIAQIVRTPIEDGEKKNIRTGYMVTLVGVLLTLVTVHVWDAAAVFVSFYIGAGAFIYTRPQDTLIKNLESNESGDVKERLPYSRFVQ